jgi:Kef-type K+ transport system membrane component KefB
MPTGTTRLSNHHRGLTRPAPAPISARVPTDGEKIARGVAAVGILGVGLIHFVEVVDKLHETAYLGVLYLALIAASVVAARHLILVGDRRSWLLTGGLAGATFAAYVASRTVGLPAATDDIGNWTEPLGMASLFVESAVAVLSAEVLLRLRRTG